jgi:hypothetical protein
LIKVKTNADKVKDGLQLNGAYQNQKDGCSFPKKKPFFLEKKAFFSGKKMALFRAFFSTAFYQKLFFLDCSN